MDNQTLELEKREVWHCHYKNSVGIEISLHGLVRPNNWEPLNNGKGCWCAYIYIHEQNCPRFEEIWLEDELVYTVNWHCGMTFYVKLCSVPGHRYIKAGCDYSHIWDAERGYNFTLKEILQETKQTADELIDLLQIKENK